jgi:uncharacterized protein (UPF0332 family)
MGERENRLEIADNYLLIAKQKLKSAEILLNAGQFDDSISRSYYAVFLSAKANLYVIGEDPKTHNGLITLFGLKFIKSKLLETEYNRILIELLNARQQSDYNPISIYEKEDAQNNYQKAKKFLERMESLIEYLKKQ